MRDLARLAGVSAQAVSLALRDHPRIAVQTRRRIRRIAEQAGYCPDPHVAKLMHHLRVARRTMTVANVCALTTRPPGSRESFCDQLLEGAAAAAVRAGFNLQTLYLGGQDMSGGRLRQILRSRGVEGIVLLPMAEACSLDDLLDWRELSVVSATLSVLSPLFDSVAANHFKNVHDLCTRLWEAGYRRPGLVISPGHDARCRFAITGAHAWHGIYGRAERLPAHFCEQVEPASLRRWLRAEEPDVLLVQHDELARSLQAAGSLFGSRPIVSCSARPVENGQFPFPGNYERPAEIGATAVELLTQMITTGRRGIPQHPRTTLIDGVWVGSLRRGPAPAGGPGASPLK